MLYFVYSSHKSLSRAQDALEDYFANGEISLGERPFIRRIGKRFCVMFPGC